jgi:hypothetical protein
MIDDQSVAETDHAMQIHEKINKGDISGPKKKGNKDNNVCYVDANSFTPRRLLQAYHAQARRSPRPPEPHTPRTTHHAHSHTQPGDSSSSSSSDAARAPSEAAAPLPVATAAAAAAAALPADSAALKDLPAPIEQHVELGIADDPVLLARARALDVLALELEELRGHLRDRLPCLAGLAAPADGHLELA